MSVRSMKSVLVVDFMNYNWIADDNVTIKFHDVINFERANKRENARRCVMCGLREDNQACFIPTQNKDVCRRCDSSYWLLKEYNVIVKFCKGCKTFFELKNYDDKPEASKCSFCRRRGRDNYHNKKVKRNQTISESSMNDGGSNQHTHSFQYSMTIPEAFPMTDVQDFLQYAVCDLGNCDLDCDVGLDVDSALMAEEALEEDLSSIRKTDIGEDMSDVFNWLPELAATTAPLNY